MSDFFYVPENSGNLVSISKLTRGGAKVVFGEKSCIEQGNGTVYPLSERGNPFIWKIIGFRTQEKLSVDKVKINSSEFRVNKTFFAERQKRRLRILVSKMRTMINVDDMSLEPIQKLKRH